MQTVQRARAGITPSLKEEEEEEEEGRSVINVCIAVSLNRVWRCRLVGGLLVPIHPHPLSPRPLVGKK